MGLINEGNFHVFVSGNTQSGKSTFTHRALLQIRGPVLYFNIQGEKVPRGFMNVYSTDVDTEQLIEMLKDGMKINLIFSNPRTGYDYVAGHVMNAIMDAGFDDQHPVYVCIDECHLLKGYSLEIAKYVATAGLKKGQRLVCITQRPALADKTLYTQAFEHYIFFIAAGDAAYMKSKGIDYEFCKAEWESRGEHSYCYYNGYQIEGRNPLTI